MGEFEASGLTPAELCEAIKKKAISLYSLPGEHPVDVRITVSRSRVYYVLGQVLFPGPKVATGHDTVLTALATAQPTVLAWADYIRVIRPSASKKIKPKIFQLNYNHMIKYGDTSKNILLQEGDIVYVPPTVLASMAMVVEEAVRPIGRAFSTVNIIQGPATTR